MINLIKGGGNVIRVIYNVLMIIDVKDKGTYCRIFHDHDTTQHNTDNSNTRKHHKQRTPIL